MNNEVKVMKRIYVCIGIFLACTLTAYGRMYTTGEKVYINAVQNDGLGDWSQADAKLFLYFFQSTNHSNSEWVALSRVGTSDVFEGTVTSYHAWYDRVSVIRKSPSGTINNWSERWNQSCNIIIPDNSHCNYLSEFYKKDHVDADCGEDKSYTWFYHPIEDPTLTTLTKIDQAEREVVDVCTQSTGDPFSLQPRLISPTEGYDYNQAHTWFKWDGSRWQEIAHHSDWGFDGAGGLNETIGIENSYTYYFLSTANHSKQRFIEMAVTKDCSPTCEITDFGVVTSNVNIHDSTYVLDGIVAFKDATGKTLRISVTDEKGEHHVDYDSPTTPFIFSLPGLFANGASGITATASFLGTEYSRTSAPYIVPDAINSEVNIDTINKTHGEGTTIDPVVYDSHLVGSHGFKWHDGNTTDHVRNIPAYNFDTTIVYTYYEYEELPEVGGNLITNGDFSMSVFDYGAEKRQKTIVGSNISDYNYWGKDIATSSNFYNDYKDPDSGDYLSGGMAIVTDANNFWKRFTKKIVSKTGDHFALFDADNSGEKAAWIVETDAITQPNLKLAKGANYMFSFWVANINNYGEMNNAAILQFEISYSTDGGATWSAPKKLGQPIDLNDYPDNLWHQNSYVYVATDDADKVRISVKDLNTNSNPGGNDFALDDIKFQPISVVSQAIKYWHRFVVRNYEDPVVVGKPQITITQTPACGNTDFEMQVKVDYSTLNTKYPVAIQLTDNLYGAIFDDPVAIDPAVHPNSVTFSLPSATYAKLVADGKEHTLTATIIREDEKHADKGGSNSQTYTSPGVPAMKTPVLTELNLLNDKTTFDLEIATQYIAFKGTRLYYVWDGAEWTDATVHSISYKESTWQTVKDTLRNLIADGKQHTLRVYSDHTLDCEYTFSAYTAPYMPSVTVSAPEILAYSCGDGTYDVKVTASFTNGQLHKILFKDWKTGEEKEVETTSNDGTASYTFTYDWDAAPTSHEYNVYFAGATTCDHKTSYLSPAQPALTVTPSFENAGCDMTTYSLRLNLNYTNQRGNTILAHVDDGTDVTKPNAHISQMSAATDYIQIDNLPADGKKHTYTLRFSDAKDCSKSNINFTAPYGPKINTVAATVLPYVCGDGNYTVKVEVTDFVNGQGHDLIIEEVGGATHHVTTAPGDTKKGFSLTYGWNAAATHEYKLYFEGAEACSELHKVFVTSPAEPKIKNIDYTIPPVTACDKTTYDMTVTFDYTNQDGDLSVNVDGIPATTITPIIPNIAVQQTATATFVGLPADGGDMHKLNISFDGTHGCVVAPITLTGVPHLPVINSVTQSLTPDYICGEDQYHVTLQVNYTNALGKMIRIKDGSDIIKSVPANAGADTLDISIPLDFHFGTDHNLSVYFDGRETCAANITVTSPAKPKVTATSEVINAGCDKTTYDLEVTVKYTNQNGTLHVRVDGKDAEPETLVYTPDATEELTLIALVKDLPADGADTHVLTVAFTGGSHSCAIDPINITAPFSPVINNVVVTGVPTTILCDEMSYTANVAIHMPFDATGKIIVLSYEGKDTTITVTSNPTYAVLPLVTTDATGLAISAAYTDALTCPTLSNTYDAPTRISCVKDATTVCEGESYLWDVTGQTYGPFTIVKTDTIASDINVHDTLIVTVHPQPAISLIAIDTLYTDVTEIRLPYTVTEGTPNKFVITWAGSSTTQARSVVDTLVISKPASVTTGDYTINVQAIDSNFTTCNTDEAIMIHVAGIPTVNSISVQAREVACGADTYKADVHIEYMNPRGDIVLEDKTNGTIYTYPVSQVPYNTTYTLDTVMAFSSMTPAVHNWEAYFSGWSGVTASSVAPTVPSMVIHANAPTMAACTTTATVTFSVDYTYQQGQMEYWIDDQAHQFRVITEKSATLLTESGLTLNGFDADDKTHTIHVKFNGPNSCEKIESFTAPFSPVIDDVSVTGVPATILCDELSYNVAVVVTTHFDATGKNIVLSYEGKDTTITVAGNPTVVSLPMTSADASGLTVSAALSDAPVCATVSNTYSAPTRLSCVKDYATVCEGESYKWPYNDVTYGPFMTVGKDTLTNAANIHDTLIVTVRPQPEISLIVIDTLYEDATGIRLPYIVTKGTPNTFRVTIIAGDTVTLVKTAVDTLVLAKPAGVTTGDYTATVIVRDSTLKCFTTETLAFHVAGVPTVNSIAVTPREIGCDASSYVVDVHVEYMNPRGDIVLEDKTNGTIYTYPVSQVPYNTTYTLDTVMAFSSMTPAVHNWEAYFSGWSGVTASSVAPTVPSMVIHANAPTMAACTTTATVTFSVDYTYQQGQMEYWIDDQAHQFRVITEKSATLLTESGLTLNGFDADDKTHTIHVKFNGPNSCEKIESFTAPFSPVIDDVSVTGVPATILCDELSYNVAVVVTTHFDATGKNIVLSYEGKDTTITVAGNPTVVSLPMTSADASGLTVSAALSDAPACATVSNTYNAPARWSCDRDYKDICLGDTYTWHNTPYTPTSAGTFGYNDNYDSLYLIVHAEPSITMLPVEMVCADENQIRLPYAITSGTPNFFEVMINGQSFSQAKSNTDTIVLSRPTSIPAGTYTATITVRDSLVNCFSTIKAIFTIAQAEMMYRKWDDLIFIDNSDNLFTAYQWYENGIALSNETNQYLHTPNGLPGIYCCRMITTTNDTIYTCEKAFDDIPRSRDITYTTQNITVSPTYVRTRGSITIRQTADTELHITLYDATGKVISQHTQMNEEDCISAPYSEGIYFVRVQYGEDIKTVKIIVHE